MIFKIRFGKWKFTATLAPVIDVVGVNSILPDGNHIVMWDFDDVPLDNIIEVLIPVQWFYHLSNIYILNTGKPNSYIAYCFTRMDFMTVCAIIASTPYICENFFKWGVFRHRFTLRVTPKSGRTPKCVVVLASSIPEDVNIHELKSFVQYETIADKWKRRVLNVGERHKDTRGLRGMAG